MVRTTVRVRYILWAKKLSLVGVTFVNFVKYSTDELGLFRG